MPADYKPKIVDGCQLIIIAIFNEVSVNDFFMCIFTMQAKIFLEENSLKIKRETYLANPKTAKCIH